MGRTPRPMFKWTPGEQDLFQLALGWLREDRDVRRKHEAERGRIRGPKTTDTRNANKFFEKYDYGRGK